MVAFLTFEGLFSSVSSLVIHQIRCITSFILTRHAVVNFSRHLHSSDRFLFDNSNLNSYPKKVTEAGDKAGNDIEIFTKNEKSVINA